MVAIFGIAVLAVAVIRGTMPSVPNLEARAKAYQPKLDPSNPLTISQSFNKKYKGFKDFLYNKAKEDSLKNIKRPGKQVEHIANIRAAFYTPWTAKTSLPDLEKYGDSLNTIFPEWFFIDTLTHTLQTRIDSAGLAMMRKKNLQIMPMLTNYNSFKKEFDAALLHDILNNAGKRKSFISNLTDTLVHYQFKGINIDFEELKEKTNEPLTLFQKELYESLHAKGMMVTMDVAVHNDDYDYEKLSAYNDYIILMAYDQFNDASGPGPVSGQKWIEEAVDWTAKKIESEKIILGLAGYGYDWIKDEEGKTTVRDITYDDAINIAKIKNAQIDFDDDTYNLHFQYSGLEKDNETGEVEMKSHTIWFTDAATTFNIMRFSDENEMGGTALWRMGSEDERMWNFYNRDLSNESLETKPFDFNSIANIAVNPNDVTYDSTLGNGGEILDITGTPQPGRIKIELDSAEMLIAEQHYEQLPSGYIIQKFAEDTTEGSGHKLILTFDDGPNPEWTPKILDILEREKVPATFFVVGLQVENNSFFLKSADSTRHNSDAIQQIKSPSVKVL